MGAEQSEGSIECLQPRQAGGPAQVQIESGGREPAVYRDRNRRTHGQPHRQQHERRRSRLRTVAFHSHRAKKKWLACIRRRQAQRRQRHLTGNQRLAVPVAMCSGNHH